MSNLLLDSPAPLRNRLNFYAKRLRPAGQSFLRLSKREAAELSALLTDAEAELGRQAELLDAYLNTKAAQVPK